MRAGYCSGWEVLGSDKNWYPAMATQVDKNQLILLPNLPANVLPKQCRYAWSNWPLANVYDSMGNPMVPMVINL